MSVNGDGDAVDASIATSRRESLSVSSPKSGLNRFEDTDIYGHMQADGRIKQLQGKTLFILYEYSAFFIRPIVLLSVYRSLQMGPFLIKSNFFKQFWDILIYFLCFSTP